MNKKRWLSFFLILILALIGFNSGASYALPEASYEFYVYDEVDIINNDIEQYIISTNKDLYQKTGAQVVVAAVNSLDDMDINSYATSLFEKWTIGGKDDNGMLILIVPEEGQIWIETGYGIEGAFPDSIVNRIIEDQMIPYFREARYSDGVLAGFNEIKAGIEEEYNIEVEERKAINNPIQSNNNTRSGASTPRLLAIIGIVILLIIDFKFFGGMITYSLLRGFGRGGGGRGGGGSGGSSGGGGRSGGGGAGGSW